MSSTEWETDSDSSEHESRLMTPTARMTAETQRRPRASRPSSSLSTKSAAAVHPLLGLHPHIPSTSSSTTTLTSPPITITSHLSHQLPHYPSLKLIPYLDDPQPSPIPIPPYPALSRPRTLSTLSSPSSSAISSLAHIPTRPPSPCHPNHIRHLPSFSTFSTPPSTSNLISFFPPANPLVSLEAIHPLLPAPFLGNHLTVLAKRGPMRESLERVRAAKAKADAAGR